MPVTSMVLRLLIAAAFCRGRRTRAENLSVNSDRHSKSNSDCLHVESQSNVNEEEHSGQELKIVTSKRRVHYLLYIFCYVVNSILDEGCGRHGRCRYACFENRSIVSSAFSRIG